VTPVEVLRAAKALIATEETWCQRAEAIDANGFHINADSRYACRWCATGATFRSDPETCGRPADEFLDAAARELFREFRRDFNYHTPPHVKVNDQLGFTAVHAMFDRAIALAEAEEVGK
jgi:hypothetical protein